MLRWPTFAMISESICPIILCNDWRVHDSWHHRDLWPWPLNTKLRLVWELSTRCVCLKFGSSTLKTLSENWNFGFFRYSWPRCDLWPQPLNTKLRLIENLRLTHVFRTCRKAWMYQIWRLYLKNSPQNLIFWLFFRIHDPAVTFDLDPWIPN